MTQTMVNLNPGPRTIQLGDPSRILGDPQRLHRRRRVDHLLGTIDLNGQIRTRQQPRPRLGVSKSLAHQREGLSELVEHVF